MVHDLTITATVITATVLWVGPTSTDSLSNQSLPSHSVRSSPLHSGIISFFSINPRALASLPWRSLPPLAVAKSCQSASRKKRKRRVEVITLLIGESILLNLWLGDSPSDLLPAAHVCHQGRNRRGDGIKDREGKGSCLICWISCRNSFVPAAIPNWYLSQRYVPINCFSPSLDEFSPSASERQSRQVRS
jgi:hypothetical protein